MPEPDEGGVDMSGGGSKNDSKSSGSTSPSWKIEKGVIMLLVAS
jgi:hypothetical protein